MTLRSGMYWVALIALLLAASVSTQAGTVSLSVYAEGTGPGSSSGAVCKGCDVKFVYVASDCDEYDSVCCWDDLVFPDWPTECSEPTKVNDTIYMGESTVTCTWVGAKDFVFKANDEVQCTNQEDDLPATQTITIIGVDVTAISVNYAPWPICPCPEGTVEFTASTNPSNHENLIPWSGGGVPETGTGQLFSTYWTTPGTKTVTAGCGESAKTFEVEVKEPFHETSFVDLTGPVGGTRAVKYQVKTRCTTSADPLVDARRTAQDPWEPLMVIPEVCSTLPDENGIVTATYPLILWNTVNRVDNHNLDRNGSHMLRALTEFSVCPYTEAFTDTESTGVGVKNLVVESANPEGVVYWTGEEGTTVPITVTIDDNDLSDPVTLTLALCDTGQDNRGGWSASAILTAENVTTTSHTFNWNGTDTGQPDGNLLASGTYTYEVTATQGDDNECLLCSGVPPENPCSAADIETYRSEYLRIVRAADASGNPIFDLEYDGYDNNGTEEDESDDGYFYVIRKYELYDTLGTNASQGVIWLYGPDGEKCATEWPIDAQPCLAHNENDGLHVNLQHDLRIRVPVSAFNYAGTYRFVLHIKDDHADLYRDENGDGKWALDLNSELPLGGAAVWATNNYPLLLYGYGEEALSYLKRIYEPRVMTIGSPPTDPTPRKSYVGYLPHPPPGDPAKGGSGLLKDKSARLTIRTLNRLCDTEVASHPEYAKYLTKNAIWGYYGHGYEPDATRTSGLTFNGGPAIEDINNWLDEPRNQKYDIGGFGLGHVKFAFLAACYSAGGVKGQYSTDPKDSIAEECYNRGAKCALGFYGEVCPQEPVFKMWHKRFWDYLCKEGMSVQGAANTAMSDARKEISDRFWQWPFSPLIYKIRGQPKTVLWPADVTP